MLHKSFGFLSMGLALLIIAPAANAQPTHVAFSCQEEDLAGTLRELWRQGLLARDAAEYRNFFRNEKLAVDFAQRAATAGASSAYLEGDVKTFRASLAASIGLMPDGSASGSGNIKFSAKDLARLSPTSLLMLADLTRDLRAQTMAVDKLGTNMKRKPAMHGGYRVTPTFERARSYIHDHIPYHVERARLAALRGNPEQLQTEADALETLEKRFDEELGNYKQIQIRSQGKVLTVLNSFERIWRVKLNLAHGKVTLLGGFLNNDSAHFERAGQFFDRALENLHFECTPLIQGKILLLKGRALLEMALSDFAKLRKSWPSPDAGEFLSTEQVDQVRAIIKKIKAAEKTITAGVDRMPFHQRAIDWARGFFLLTRAHLERGRVIRETEAMLEQKGRASVFRFERPHKGLVKYAQKMAAKVIGDNQAVRSGFSAIFGFRRPPFIGENDGREHN